ncbi:MAG: cation:proton antiporter [Nocardioides sp.]|uniref:cation:proton antiporter n=1 Tax=Nocardioides sp. TaxID=35761 RepID=UPI003F0DC97C
MPHELILIVVGGLAILVVASVLSHRTGIAAPLLLLAFGIGASYVPGMPEIEVAPEVILAGVLPPLLYASAVRMPILDVRRNLGLIAWLSVVLVIVSALVVGVVVHWLFPHIPFALAVALGAVLSPTDAVAATAIGKRLGLPPRLMTVLEGESLVNDASALVVLRTALAAGAVGTFSLGDAALDFAWAVAGAVLVGLAVGWATVLLRQRLGDPVLNTTISFAVPFLSYFPAEELGASGVLAVVVAGLITGHQAMRRFTAHDRQSEATNWATVNFVLESGVFLLMGLELPALVDQASAEGDLADLWLLVAVLVGLLVLLRFVGVAGPLLLGRRVRPVRRERVEEWLGVAEQRIESLEPETETQELRLDQLRRRVARTSADVAFERREPLTGRGGLVLAWAGMRGVVTLAAAQSIPHGTEHRATLVLAAFTVAVVSLVGFGGTLPALIRRLNFAPRTKARNAELSRLMKALGERSVDLVGPMAEITVDGEKLDPELVEWISRRFIPLLMGTTTALKHRRPDSWERSLIVQRRYLEAMQEALWEERSIGAYSSATYAAAQGLLDREERRINPVV